jgi:hypothetical protein
MRYYPGLFRSNMKRLFLFLPAILFAISVSAQNKTIRVGLFKRWYIGAFEEVTGKYSLAIDTATYDFEKYDEEEAAFWEEQYDHYYSGPFDSLRLIITKDLIIFDNEVFNAVYTVRAKPKYPYYYIAARNNRNLTLSIIIFPDDPAGWQIYISDSDKREWGGIWTRVPLTDGSLFFSQRRKDAKAKGPVS